MTMALTMRILIELFVQHVQTDVFIIFKHHIFPVPCVVRQEQTFNNATYSLSHVL